MNEQRQHERMELPESLKQQLAAFEKRLCTVETIVAALGGACGVLLTYALLFLSDRVWDTPWWLRTPLTLGGGLLLAWFAVRWLRSWWWARRDTRQLARLVQRRYRGLGDRLLGAVELASGDDIPENISPALCRAAIEQVSREASKFDFKEAVDRKRTRVFGVVALVLVVVTATTFTLFPRAGWNALVRWFKPLAPVARYTFVSLEELHGERVVPHGEPFEIACRIRKQSRWKPVSASCRIKGQPRIDTRVRRGQAVFRLPGQTRTAELAIRIGDVSRTITIVPVYRPELRLLRAAITLPDYLERPVETQQMDKAAAAFLEGSTIELEGEVTRDLAAADLALRPAAPASLAIRANTFRSTPFSVDALEACRLSWTDRHALTNPTPYEVSLSTHQDEPPLVECRGITRAIAILQEEVVKIDIGAEDDFGLKEMWVNWSSMDSGRRGLTDVQGTETLKTGSPTTLSLAETFSFSPIASEVPEETMLSLAAYASDYMPGRKPAMSLLYRIYVLSKAQHAKLIQEQMEALQARLEDLAREEEDLLTRNRELAKQDPADLQSDKTTSRLKDSENTERSNQEQLDNMAREGEEILEEALRNNDIPENTLAKWSEMVQTMSKLSQNQMREATQNLGQARRNKEQRAENLEQAIQKEQEIVEQLREMEKKMDSSIKDMMAKSFINRLRMAASIEQEIASALQVILPDTVGIAAGDLPDDARETIDRVSQRQKSARVEVKYIQDDLAGFYNRTRTDVYNTIHSEMIQTNVVKHLTELTGLIADNVGVRAIEQAGHWKDHLNRWADLLEEKMQQSGGQGGGQGNMAQVDLEVLIALLRARQREESIRDQTRVLEEGRKTNRRYPSTTRKLADVQRQLAMDTAPLERKVRDPRVRRLVDKIYGEMMNANRSLRIPRTDSETIAIETEIIELLSASIQSTAQQAGAMGMAMMQAMGMGMPQMGMGAGAGQAGGGSMAGGTTTDANITSTGPSAGDPNGARDVEKTGGIDPSEFPAEFRDALEAYFNAVETP